MLWVFCISEIMLVTSELFFYFALMHLSQLRNNGGWSALILMMVQTKWRALM